MSRTRENFYECSLTHGYDRLTSHVRAWSAAEAETVFRQELAEEGVEGGTIVVAGGREQRRSSRPGRKAAAH